MQRTGDYVHLTYIEAQARARYVELMEQGHSPLVSTAQLEQEYSHLSDAFMAWLTK